MKIGERIELARNAAKMSKRSFALALQPSKAQGISYPAIHRYLTGKTEPSGEFVVAAAGVLGVTPGWLLTGDGPRTPKDAENQRKALEQLPELMDPDRHGWLYVKDLELGRGLVADVRRDALLRFVRKLDSKSQFASEFFETGERTALVQAAAAFLVGVEETFQAASRTPLPNVKGGDRRPLVTGGILLGDSRSGGWHLTWADAVLELFARRVIGLGERSGRWVDAHHPAGPNPEIAEYLAWRKEGEMRLAEKEVIATAKSPSTPSKRGQVKKKSGG